MYLRGIQYLYCEELNRSIGYTRDKNSNLIKLKLYFKDVTSPIMTREILSLKECKK